MLKIKKGYRGVIAIVIVISILIGIIIPTSLSILASETKENTTFSFEDDFNRSNGEIGNDWIVGSNATVSINDESVVLHRTSPTRGTEYKSAYVTESSVIRPLSEAILDQTVSAEFVLKENETKPDVGGALIARCQGTSANNSNCYRMYVRLGYNGKNNTDSDIVLYNSKNEIVYSAKSNGTSPNLSSGEKYRLQLNAKSVSATETQLTMIMTVIKSDNKESEVFYKTVNDSDENLQNPGTAGFSMFDLYGLNMSIDNFKYSTIKEDTGSKGCIDNFNRLNGEIGNGWVLGSKASATINDNAVILHRNPANRGTENKNAYVTESAVMRPMSEKMLDQEVSAEFKVAESQKKPDIGGALIARCQGATATNSNCYRAYVRLGYDGANNTTSDIVLFNSKEKIFSAKASGISPGVNSDVKYRLILCAKSVSNTQTEITIKMFVLNSDGTEISVFNKTLKDNDENLQSAGTAGFSMYDYYGLNMGVDNFSFQAPVEEEKFSKFTDNFNRSDGSIGNGWILGSKADATINDNAVILHRNPANRGTENKNAYVTESAVMRPMSEKMLDQEVSAEFKVAESQKKADIGGALIARCQGATATNSNCYRAYVRLGYDGANNTSSDIVLYNTKTKIYSSKSQNTSPSLNSDICYRFILQAKTISSTETELTIKIIVINNDSTEKEVFNKTVVDKDENLQSAGTVGFSMYDYYGLNMQVDNFIYQEVKEEKGFQDKFDRTDGEIGNGWILGSKADAKISDKSVILHRNPANRGTENRNAYVTESAVMRPMSEKMLDQEVSAEFKVAESQKKADIGGALIARCQGETATNSNCYRVYVRLGYDGANNTSSDIVLYNTKAKIYSAKSQNESPNLNSDVQYKLVFRVKSINETKSEITIIMLLINNDSSESEVFRKTIIDNDENLQSAGTAGFSMYEYYGLNMSIDNFCVSEPQNDEEEEETEISEFSDDFDRSNGPIGNGWVLGSKADASIKDNAVLLHRNPANRGSENRNAYVTESAVMRPMSEKMLDQVVSAEFKVAETQKKADIGGALIARCQGATATDNNCYRVYVRLGYDGANNTTSDIVLYNSNEKIFSSKSDGSSPGLSSDAKYRVELRVKSVDEYESQITIVISLIDNDDAVEIFKKTIRDDDDTLQKAGTVGFSMYEYYGLNMTVDNFKYSLNTEEIQETTDDTNTGVVKFFDNFDDSEGAISENNGWIDQYYSLKDSSICLIKDGELVLDAGEKADSFTKKIMRPLTEASLNQKVSVDILNLGECECVEIDLRMNEIADNNDAVNRQSYYILKVLEGRMVFATKISWMQGEFAGTNFDFVSGHKYRVVVTAEGCIPTVLTAKLYDLSNGNKEVASLTGRDESLHCHDLRTAQNPSTVGLSNSGKVPARLDNFNYVSMDNVICIDNFSRTKGNVGNDWEIVNSGTETQIKLKKLLLSNGKSDNIWSASILRPSSEKLLDQYSTVVFSRSETGNKSGPVVFARVNSDEKINIDGSNAFSCYYAKLEYTGDWSSKVSICKVTNAGETVLLKEQLIDSYGLKSTQKTYFSLLAQGNSPTKLNLLLYSSGSNGKRLVNWANITVTDDQSELQKAGTTGISYTGSQQNFYVEKFIYNEPPELIPLPSIPDDMSGNYMAYFTGTVAAGEFGQWLELDPSKEYVFTYRLKKIMDTGGLSPRVQCNVRDSGNIYRDFSPISVTSNPDTFVNTLVFKAPDIAHRLPNGKVRIKVVIHEGGLSSVGYATDFSVYEKDDENKTNLLVNPNFKKGFFGWVGHGSYVQGAEVGGLTKTLGSGEVELLPYDENAFIRDDSDSYFNDGDWARKYINTGLSANGIIKGKIHYADGKAVSGFKVLLTPINKNTITSTNGSFVFEKLEEGFYTLSMIADDGSEVFFDEELCIEKNTVLELDLTYDKNRISDDFDSSTPKKLKKFVVKRKINNSDNAWILIVVLSAGVLVVGGAVFFFVFIKKRKKRIK